MEIKKLFEDAPGGENKHLVFALLPEDRVEFFNKHVRPAIESVEVDGKPLILRTYADFEAGTNVMTQIFTSIKQAQVVIADLSDFNPNVILEFGLAITQKDNLLPIMQKLKNTQAELPFNLVHWNIKEYDVKKPKELHGYIQSYLDERIAATQGTHLTDENKQMLKDILRQRERREWSYLDIIFERMAETQPENHKIHLEWAITKTMQGKYPEARKQFEMALENARTNGERVSTYLEQSVMYQKQSNLHEASVCFEKAKIQEPGNHEIFYRWALLEDQRGNHGDAMMLMMDARKHISDQTHNLFDEYAQRFDYYSKRFNYPNYNESYDQFKDRNPKSPFARFTLAHSEGDLIECTVNNINERLGVFVNTAQHKIKGLLHISNCPEDFAMDPHFKKGQNITLVLHRIKKKDKQLDFTLPRSTN